MKRNDERYSFGQNKQHAEEIIQTWQLLEGKSVNAGAIIPPGMKNTHRTFFFSCITGLLAVCSKPEPAGNGTNGISYSCMRYQPEISTDIQPILTGVCPSTAIVTAPEALTPAGH